MAEREGTFRSHRGNNGRRHACQAPSSPGSQPAASMALANVIMVNELLSGGKIAAPAAQYHNPRACARNTARLRKN
nr:hypothetical protein SHINE37_44796 [Rhizobiaceae bacterium]